MPSPKGEYDEVPVAEAVGEQPTSEENEIRKAKKKDSDWTGDSKPNDGRPGAVDCCSLCITYLFCELFG